MGKKKRIIRSFRNHRSRRVQTLCTVFLCAFCACVSFSSVSNKTCDELQKDLWVGENPREAAKRREGREERGRRVGGGGGGGMEGGVEQKTLFFRVRYRKHWLVSLYFHGPW